GANSQGLSITNSIDVGPGHELFLFGGPVIVSGFSTKLLTHGGLLWVVGTGTASVNDGGGVEINGAELDSGTNRTLAVHGTGTAASLTQQGDTGVSDVCGGWVHNGGKVQAEGSGTVTMTGNGGNGLDFNHGVFLADANTAVTTVDGNLWITGTSKGSRGSNDG